MADYSHFYNAEGEPMQDGPSMRSEMAFDAEMAAQVSWEDRYFDDGFGPDFYDPSEYEDDTESVDTDEEWSDE